MKTILSPSLLAADFSKLGEQIKQTEYGGAEYLHFDVMDGMFVPSISFGMPVLKSIKHATDQIMDVHLMINEPIRYLEDFKQAGADIITVHLEACKDVQATINKLKELEVGIGLSIKPETPVKDLEAYLTDIQMVLVMSVNPGFGGQKFIPSTLDKIRELRQIITEQNLTVDIQVDGGIYLDNVKEVLAAGANIIVAGSAIYGGNPAQNTADFMEILKTYE